jgi:hypothetical protein
LGSRAVGFDTDTGKSLQEYYRFRLGNNLRALEGRHTLLFNRIFRPFMADIRELRQ